MGRLGGRSRGGVGTSPAFHQGKACEPGHLPSPLHAQECTLSVLFFPSCTPGVHQHPACACPVFTPYNTMASEEVALPAEAMLERTSAASKRLVSITGFQPPTGAAACALANWRGAELATLPSLHSLHRRPAGRARHPPVRAPCSMQRVHSFSLQLRRLAQSPRGSLTADGCECSSTCLAPLTHHAHPPSRSTAAGPHQVLVGGGFCP